MNRQEAAKILYSEKSNAGWMRWVGFPVDNKKEEAFKAYSQAIDVALDALCSPQPSRQTPCHYCSWIDPALIEEDEVDGPQNYCRVCGRDLRVPETAQKTGQEAHDERG